MIPTLLLTILAVVAIAPKDDSPEKRGRGRGGEMCETLECTETQKNEMKEIRAQLRTDLEDERAEQKRLRAAFVAEKQKADPDPETIAKLRTDMDANRDAMRVEFEEAKTAMREVLDEKQEAQLDEALAKGKHKGHGRGKGHLHGKGRGHERHDHGKADAPEHGKAHAHGKAHGKGKDKDKAKDKAKGKDKAKPEKDRGKDKKAKKDR
jgi:Spy/CpxP family protein refolding chaperone